MKQSANPTRAEVKALHQQVQAAIRELYYRHRHLLKEFETRELELV